MSLISTFKFIIEHPLNRSRRLSAIKKFLAWQIGSRLVPGAVAVPFVNDSRLLVSPGMTGATGNIYTGLHEFEDMAFLLHLLRPEDLFVDVGANIGSYTILASGVVGARSLSFEPLPTTCRHLEHNINLNDIKDLAKAHNLGIGKEDAVLHFTEGLDTVNHVATEAEKAFGLTLGVKVVTLDSIVGNHHPRLIKIDVEGFETNVVAGATRILSDHDLDAVIMELNGSGSRYGYDEEKIHKKMLAFGFSTFGYSPFKRELFSLESKIAKSGNTLYLKNIDHIKERLGSAPKFHIKDRQI